MVRTILNAALGCALLSGCARSTIETRKQERYGVYVSLPDDSRTLVDRGQIKVGMDMDAVYIAWGKPNQVFTGETPDGATTTWLYHGTHLEPHRYWTSRRYFHGGSCYSDLYLAHDYWVRTYVKGEVIFQDHLVKLWRSLPQPVGY